MSTEDKKKRFVLIGVEIAESGFEHLGFRTIAHKIGCSAQSIYYHFPGGTKELRDAVISNAIKRNNSRIIVQLIGMRDPAVKGYRLVDFI